MQHHWIQGICQCLKQVSVRFGKSIVISDLMKASLATDNEMNNEGVVRNTDNFFPKSYSNSWMLRLGQGRVLLREKSL